MRLVLAAFRTLTPDYPHRLGEHLGGKAEMRVYDPCLGGAIYCAKVISSPDASYDFVNFPSLPGSGLPNAILHSMTIEWRSFYLWLT